MKTLIKNGQIIDGSGNPGYLGDILISEGKIEKIGTSITDAGAQVIDAAGLVVAPGFIDTHSHSDLQVLVEPEVAPKVMQGITTEVLGQDAISMSPLPKEYISPWRKNLAGLDGDSDDIDWTFETTENYLNMIDAVKPGLNECYLVPHGNIRMEAMGLENRLPNEEELEKMRQITRREMQAGAVGLSTGLIYMPCAYSESKEIIEMCKVVAEYDGIFVIHQRSEADTILDSMEEVIRIGRESGYPLTSIPMWQAALCWESFFLHGSMTEEPTRFWNAWQIPSFAKRWFMILSTEFRAGITSWNLPDWIRSL